MTTTPSTRPNPGDLCHNPIRAERCRVSMAMIRKALDRIDSTTASGDAAMVKLTHAADIVSRCYQGWMGEDAAADELTDLVPGNPSNGDDSGWMAKHVARACALIFDA